MKKNKGRPRKFDADQVLQSAASLFARKGFSATSLDELSEVTGLVRPSLYNAFGDKLSLYRMALAYQLRETHAILRSELSGEADLNTELDRLFDAWLEFCRREGGWLTLCTAPAEAVNHPEVAEDLSVLMAALGQLLETRFEKAREGEFRAHVTPVMAAQMTQAILHSIALRARAGEAEGELGELARTGVVLVLAD